VSSGPPGGAGGVLYFNVLLGDSPEEIQENENLSE
jgi:hypothetical protein